ncbi:unnamed protein product [Heterobilharzia americana]|nr:unnamed protein product [Heterobilharzia americana]
MSSSRLRKERRKCGLVADIINFDPKNESCPLKQEVAVKRNGGLFLSLQGVKIEIPPGASTGRRERVLCTAFPSTARAAIGPWLGQNMRMASDIHMLYSPVRFKIPVAVFIPFSFAAAREMSYPGASITMTPECLKISESKSSSQDGSQPNRSFSRSRGKAPYTMHFSDLRPKLPNLIDARSVSLLQCRLGDDRWQIVEKFTVVQPTIHYRKWPLEARKIMSKASRWQENLLTTETSSPPPFESTLGRCVSSSGKNRHIQNQLQKEHEPYDFMNKIENYCGGVFIYTEELNHCYLLVNSNKTEQFWINQDGGLFLSPLLNPFLSIRIPKRVCSTNEKAIFKTIEIRSSWLNLASLFDAQLNQIEGCSNIFDLQLQDVELKRPATIRLPLPQWYIDKRNKTSESIEQSVTAGTYILSNTSAMHSTMSETTAAIQDKGLVVLYQPSEHIRKIVWQSTHVEEQKEEVNKPKARVRVNLKDNLNSSKCRIDNIFIRLGWSNLLVGIKGGPWKPIKQPVYYTKRTICFDTTVLGRFVLIGARDSERTASSKLAHLMPSIESLACAPPGALLICLQITHNNWRIMANIYPEEQLGEAIQTQVAAGYIPLVQFGAGIVRKATGLNNAILQALEYNQSVETGERRYRVTGHDINHVLMFNGLCLELRFEGDIQMKPVSQFDAYTNCIRFKEKEVKPGSLSSPDLMTTDKDQIYTLTETNFDFPCNLQRESNLSPTEKKLEEIPHITLLTKHARMQLHELLSDTSCTVEIQPILSTEEKYTERSAIKLQYMLDLLKKPTPQLYSQENKDEDEFDVDDDKFDEEIVPDRLFSGCTEETSTFEEEKDIDEVNVDRKSLEDKSHSLTLLSQAIFDRFESMIENGEITESAEFVTKIHELYHVGTVEVWLIPPDNMSQIEIKKEAEVTEDMKPELLNIKIPCNLTNLKPTGKSILSVSPTYRPTTISPLLQDTKSDPVDKDKLPGNQESYNIIHVNTVSDMKIAKEKHQSGVIMADFPSNLEAPLVTYNVMIDPDIVTSYLKHQTSKSRKLLTGENVTNGLGKSIKTNSMMTRRKSSKQQRYKSPSIVNKSIKSVIKTNITNSNNLSNKNVSLLHGKKTLRKYPNIRKKEDLNK